MADISITLVLDDTQYTGKLKAAGTQAQATGAQIQKSMTDAATTFDALNKKIQELNSQLVTMESATRQAAAAMADHQNRTRDMGGAVAGLTGQFESLATAIVGASLTSFIGNAMQAASTTVRMAEAIGITTEQFLQLSAGAVAAGKDQDSLGRAMLRMEATAEQANEGSGRLRSAYAALGLSMEDLHRMDPAQSFLSIARALAAMEDPGKKAELTMMLLGRDAKTIDWPAFVAGAERATGAMGQHTQSIEDASRAYREIQNGLKELSRNVLDLLDPFMKLIGDDASGILGARSSAEALVVVLGLIAGSAIVSSIQTLVGAVGSLIPSFAGAAAATSAATAATISLGEAQAAVAATGTALRASVAATYSGIVPLAEAEAALATASNAAAAAQIRLTEAMGAAAAAGVAAAGIFTRMATALGVFVGMLSTGGIVAAFEGIGVAAAAAGAAMLVPVAEFAAGLALVAAAGVGINSAIKYAFDIDPITAMGTVIEDLLIKFGLLDQKTRDISAGMGAFDSGKGNNWEDKNTPLVNTPSADPYAARIAGLKNQIELQRLLVSQADQRWKLEMSLADAGEEVRSIELGMQQITFAGYQKDLEIQGRIKVLEAERAEAAKKRDGDAVGFINRQIAALQEENQLEIEKTAIEWNRTNQVTRAMDAHKMDLLTQNELLKIADKIAEVEEKTAGVAGSASDQAVAALQKQEDAARRVIIERERALMGPAGGGERQEKELMLISMGFDHLRESTRKYHDELYSKESRNIFDAMDIKVGDQIVGIQRQIMELTMSAHDRAIQAVKDRQAAEIESVVKSLEAAKKARLTDEERDAVIRRVTAAYRGEISAAEELYNKSRDFSTGWTRAWQDYVDTATDSATKARDMFSAMTSDMNSALDNFVMTGKLSFGDLATSIIQDIVKIQLKAQAANLVGALGGASGGAGFLGSLLGSAGSFFSGLFAEGGDIPAGGIGIVGEAGPELVRGPASVTSNRALSQMGGGDTITHVHNYNIQAVDAKSVTQLFAENRQTMFGMVEQARRELPMRTR